MSNLSGVELRRLVAVAFGLMLLHNLDEAFGHPETGGKTNLVTVLLVGVLVIWWLPRMPRLWRIGILGLLGLDAFIQGLLGHVVHLFTSGASFIDVSGVLFAAGGALLIVLSVGQWRGGHEPGVSGHTAPATAPPRLQDSDRS